MESVPNKEEKENINISAKTSFNNIVVTPESKVSNNNEMTELIQEKHLEKEVKQLMDLFNKKDENKDGFIFIPGVLEILKENSWEADHTKILTILEKHGLNSTELYSFHDLLTIIYELEMQKNITNSILDENSFENTTNQTKNKNIIGVNFRCERENKYMDAEKAFVKIQEIQENEMKRQLTNISILQSEEINKIENEQKKQFFEFTEAWDKYMTDYEANAYLTIEKLKESQIKEIESYKSSLMIDLSNTVKPCKDLVLFRKQQEHLCKLNQYNEALKIKSIADGMEKIEKERIDKELEKKVEMKLCLLRKQHQMIMSALLNRIQRQRDQQLRQRQTDSQKLVLMNKHVKRDLEQKHRKEAKQAQEIIKQPHKKSNISNIQQKQ